MLRDGRVRTGWQEVQGVIEMNKARKMRKWGEMRTRKTMT